MRKLRSGYNLGGDVTYFINKTCGIGFRYNVFKTSNSMDDVYVEDNDGNILHGKMSDKISIPYVGPFLSIRYTGEKDNSIFTNLGLGYMGYKDEMVLIDPYEITGSAFGAAIDLGVDHVGLVQEYQQAIRPPP